MPKIIPDSARKSNGQAMAEFMLVMIPAMIILFVAVQFAVIARDATALGQFAYQAARLAAAPSGAVVTMNCPGVSNCKLRSQGNQVQVVIAMSITSDLFLGRSFLGIPFPS